MLFVTASQRTDEWYAARLGRVTGSRMKDVIAWSSRRSKDGTYPELKARADYRKELVTERLIGDLGRKEVYVTPEMQWGQMNEDLARTTYQLRTGNKVSQEGFCQHEELMAGVSTDGFVNQEGNLEIKCLAPYNHLYEIVKEGKLPEVFKPQVSMQLWITERAWCDFIGYDSRMPVGIDLFYVRVKRDEEYIAYLEAQTRQFLSEVDRDVEFFMRYLPTAERTCRACGLVFTSKIAICPGCHSSSTQTDKVIEKPERELSTLGKEAHAL